MPEKIVKSALSAPLTWLFRVTACLSNACRRLYGFSALRARLTFPLPLTTVVLGPVTVFGTGRIQFGEDILLYPHQYMETHGDGQIVLGDGVVLSTGVHLVSYAAIQIGKGSMIGEYTSIRDANHTREQGRSLRNSIHSAKPITIGVEVWIGRGVTVLSGVTIGDYATVGANAVVTRDVPARTIVAGVPAVPISSEAKPVAEIES